MARSMTRPFPRTRTTLTSSAESPTASKPASLGERAEADLAFVRGVLDRSQHFSAVPGLGGILMGTSALAAAVIASLQPSRERWLAVWMIDAALALLIGGVALVRKARRSGVPLSAWPARRFALGLMPPVFVGGVLTLGALRLGAWELLTPVWLGCYGIGVLGAGAVSSVRMVPALGACFVLLGALAVATPATWSTAWLVLGFGVAHIVAGVVVWRHHGG